MKELPQRSPYQARYVLLVRQPSHVAEATGVWIELASIVAGRQLNGSWAAAQARHTIAQHSTARHGTAQSGDVFYYLGTSNALHTAETGQCGCADTTEMLNEYSDNNHSDTPCCGW